MWKFLIPALMAGIMANAAGQQTPAPSPNHEELLQKLSSDEPVVRNDALEQLRSNPDALQDPKIKIALVNLLHKENHVKFSEDDEGYADYVAWLGEITARVVDWGDQRQVCILADGVYLQDELADHAKASLPCLLRRFSRAPDAYRGRVVAMIVQVLANGKNELEPATIQSTQETIRGALRDNDENVRADTVRALGDFGGTEMIPALEQVAKTDQAVDKLRHNFWIREYAVKAIAEIQKRVGQPEGR